MKSLYIFLSAIFFVRGSEDSPEATAATRSYYRTVTIVEPPFLMLKPNTTGLVGNDLYEGFIVDLLAEMAGRADFRYRMYLVEDGKYGVRAPDDRWTGMVGDVVAGRADMIAAPITVTPVRREALTFSDAFFHVPLTLLVQKGVVLKDLEELLEGRHGMQIGVKEGGAISDTLQSISSGPLSRLWSKIASAEPSAFVGSDQQGINRVQAGNFSLIMDRPAAEYIARNSESCDLDTQLSFPGGQKSKQYAFGLADDTVSAEQIDAINSALRGAIQDGTVETLRKKWWKDNCEPDYGHQKSSATFRSIYSLVYILTLIFLSISRL